MRSDRRPPRRTLPARVVGFGLLTASLALSGCIPAMRARDARAMDDLTLVSCRHEVVDYAGVPYVRYLAEVRVRNTNGGTHRFSVRVHAFNAEDQFVGGMSGNTGRMAGGTESVMTARGSASPEYQAELGVTVDASTEIHCVIDSVHVEL